MTQAPPSARPDSLSRLRAHRSAIYASGKVQGDFGKTIDAFPTGITPHRGQQLAELLRVESKRAGLSQTIETGFGLGLSALYIVEAALEASPAELVQHTVIDPFQRRDWNNAGLRMVREAGVGSHVTHIPEDSALALPRLAATGQQYDAAFVDGSHQFDGVFIDLFYMQRLVRPGGLIILDDYWMPAVRAALDFFAKNLGLALQTLSDEKGKPKLAFLRVPEAPAVRLWDHYIPFAA
jgi:predicted O-methyltransferase YrrM